MACVAPDVVIVHKTFSWWLSVVSNGVSSDKRNCLAIRICAATRITNWNGLINVNTTLKNWLAVPSELVRFDSLLNNHQPIEEKLAACLQIKISLDVWDLNNRFVQLIRWVPNSHCINSGVIDPMKLMRSKERTLGAISDFIVGYMDISRVNKTILLIY